tara:strand:+ start:8100 stop:9938 length:1839 start_codon:yes stop_codon:yes gene_type:complete
MIDVSTNAEMALRIVRESREFAYDTETTGLDWKVNSPIGYVFTPSPDNSIYVPVRHGGGGNIAGGVPMKTPEEKIVVHPWEKELAAAFEHRNRVGLGRVVGHHMKFDVHMSANVGVMLGRNLACTQNMAAMLDEYAKKFGLLETSERYGVTAKKGDELYRHMGLMFGKPADKKVMSEYWRLPGTDPIAYDYATGDGVSTLELYWKMDALLDEEEMSLVRDMENDLIWTVFRMERRGIAVDMSRVDALRKAAEDRVFELMAEFEPGFNPRSPLKMKKVMQDAGYTDWPLTAKGAPSFTEKWLKTNPLGKKIIEIRQQSNLINSFINPLAETHVYKGRVHANLNQLKSDDRGTISGRFSCSSPNLQQVPKRNKAVAVPYRRLFVADPGHVFWDRDYSQCEPRLFAHYSQDPSLLDGYNSTPFRDAHQVVADLLQVERDPTAKRMNMGIFTGMFPKTFAGHMGWDVERATESWNAWFREFPKVKTLQDNAKARLKNRGYVFTILGRRCRLEHPRFAYRGVSKIIQGSNADIVKHKLLRADRACEDNGDIVQVLMTIHDSFNGQHEDTDQARSLFKDIMADVEDVQSEPFSLSVPFVIEGTEGGDWAEATWGKENV